MKLTNTKHQIKTIGKDTVKLGKDVFKIPSSLFADIRQHREAMKLGYEILAQRKSESEDQNPQ